MSLLRSRKLSSRELAEACLERIDERDPDITAWERVYADEALAAAREADRKLAKSGRHGPPLLCGIPIGFKDIIAVGGKPLTAGSLALEGNIAPADSHAWERARAEGMVLLGQTKTQEFASGNNTQTAGNPTTRAKAPADRATAAAPPSARAPCPSALGLTRAAVFDGPPRRAG